jgi:glutamate/tyrosine decarboxylase-like PLP-dependent enzyme
MFGRNNSKEEGAILGTKPIHMGCSPEGRKIYEKNVQLFLDLAKYDGESGGVITSSGGPNVFGCFVVGKGKGAQITFRSKPLKKLKKKNVL